jgi:hypothetical protein
MYALISSTKETAIMGLLDISGCRVPKKLISE